MIPNEVLTEIYRRSPNAILTIDSDWIIRDSNPSAINIFGESPDGKAIETYMPEKSRKLHSKYAEKFKNSSDVFLNMSERGELSCRNAKNEEIFLDISIIKRNDGNYTALIENVTKYVSIRESARDEKDRYQQVVEGLTDNAIFDYRFSPKDDGTTDGEIYITDNLIELFGYPPETTPHKYESFMEWQSRIDPRYKPEAIARFQDFLQDNNKKTLISNYPIKDANGVYFPARIRSVKVISRKTGKVINVLGNVYKLDDVQDAVKIYGQELEKLQKTVIAQRDNVKFSLRVATVLSLSFIWFAFFGQVRFNYREDLATRRLADHALIWVQNTPPAFGFIAIGWLAFKRPTKYE